MKRIHIYTGDGKGKTTAAIGLAARALGAGLRVAFVQFLKDGSSSEFATLARLGDQFTLQAFGIPGCQGCEPSAESRDLARQGLTAATSLLEENRCDLLILDEINVAVAKGLLAESDLLALLDRCPDDLELVLTGRGATPAAIARATLVTEMKKLKHYYDAGLPRKRGIED